MWKINQLPSVILLNTMYILALLDKVLPPGSKQVLSKYLDTDLKISNRRLNYCAAH